MRARPDKAKKFTQETCHLGDTAVSKLRCKEPGNLYIRSVREPVHEGHRVVTDERGKLSLFIVVYLLKADAVVLTYY